MDGKYLQINRQFERLFNVRNEDVVGCLPQDVHYSAMSKITRGHDLRVIKSGKTEVAQHLVETELGPRTLHTVKFPVFDETGTVSGLGAVVTDITEFKRVEAALAETDERLQQAAELAGLGYAVWNVHSRRCDYCSDKYADVYDLSIEEFIEQSADTDNWMKRIHRDDRERFRNFKKIDQREGSSEFEYRVNLPDGNIRHIHEFRKPSFDEKGLLSEILFTIRDISRDKQIESKNLQVQKMEALGHLTGGIAHDFNNILTIILGNLELLDKSNKGNKHQGVLLNEAIEATNLGADLINNLMVFSEQRELAVEQINVNEVVDETVGILRRTFGELYNIDLNLCSDTLIVSTEITQFKNALINLAINARDSMPDGGKIAIETRISDGDHPISPERKEMPSSRFAILSISDSGVGISPDVQDRIFEPFYSTKNSGQGVGLGLSVVYGFVNQAGGNITVDSSVGTGTKISITIPVAATENKSNTLTEALQDNVVNGRGEKVLVVEDDDHVRSVTSKRFEMLNYAVLEASNAKQALDTVSSEPDIDLLFTDIIMPGGTTGVDLARQVRARNQNIKIILTTGYSGKQHDLEKEFVVIRKPYRHNQLENALINVGYPGEIKPQ